MGLQVNGRNVAAMRFNGRDAIEARCNGSVVWPVGEPPSDDRLRFVAEEAGSTITLTVVGTLSPVPVLEYSLDAGRTWTEFRCDNAPVITLANVGDTVWMRGNNTTLTSSTSSYTSFVMSGKIAAYGSIEYLRSKSGAVTTLANYCYAYMFRGCTSLTTAPELPATTLADYCYWGLFIDCASLTTAPLLPATALASACYIDMFYNCVSLTTAPELPATTLAEQCYREMFQGCTSLTTAPELPATTLVDRCYYRMFQGCTSLTTVPELAATTLEYFCCAYMFYNCVSLTTAPELPAATLADYCYAHMFRGCTSLNYIHIAFDIWNPANATTSWVTDVAATGTFVCPEGLPQTFNTSHIPPGWVVETYDPVWPTKPYLTLANGQQIKVMEGTYDPDGPSYDPGGMVKLTAGTETSLLYPDTQSPGVNLTYELQNGAKIVYTADDAFRAYDKNGNLLALDQPLPDYSGTYNLSLFYTYAGDLLIMGFWYSTPTYLRVDRKASSGVPGQGTAIRNDTYYGITDYYLGMLHDFAMGLINGSA